MNSKRTLVGTLIAILILIVIHSLNNWDDNAFGISNDFATDNLVTSSDGQAAAHILKVSASDTTLNQHLANSKASLFSNFMGFNQKSLQSGLGNKIGDQHGKTLNNLGVTDSSQDKNSENNNTLGVTGSDGNANNGVNRNGLGGVYNNYGSGGMASNSNQAVGSGTMIYIGDYLKNQIISCNITNGVFFNCKAALVSNLNGPEGILIVNNKLYVANMNNNSITSCVLDNSGNITNCNNNPINIGVQQYPIYLVYFGQRIHTANGALNELAICALDFSQCSQSSIKNNSLLTLYTQQYNSYSYLLGYDESATKNVLVTKCVNGNMSCKFERNPLISNVSFFVLNSGYIYLDDYNKNTIVGCNLGANGDFFNCQIVSNSMAAPTGLALYSTSSNVTQLSSK